jgi:hypothetical protein
MPRIGAIQRLPRSIRSDLDEEIIHCLFGVYTGIAEWLSERRYKVSRNAAHRYGRKLKAKHEEIKRSVEHAVALAQAVKDDAGDLGNALTALVQTKLYNVLVDGVESSDLPRLASAAAQITRAGVDAKKWRLEAQERAFKAAGKAEQIAKSGGLSREAAQEIRRQILGIVR